MNLLLDFITLSQQTGAGEYQRRVVRTMLDRLPDGVRLFALWDSRLGIAYPDMTPACLETAYGIRFVDIRRDSLTDIVSRWHIDRFFIACAQYLLPYPGLAALTCEVICVIHDLAGNELHGENLDAYLQLEKGKGVADFLNWLLRRRGRDQRRGCMQPIVSLLSGNGKARLVVVSESTRQSVHYHLGIPKERIEVYYSPERLYAGNAGDDGIIKDVCDKKFFLLLGLNRRGKNGMKAIKAFSLFAREHPDCYLLTVGYKGQACYPNHIPVPFLSEAALQWAYRHCHALVYPSFFEGFGYPPLEAMRCGKPVLAGNIPPIREVFGQAPVYFCPFFQSDIYQALSALCDMDYAELCRRSEQQYLHVSRRQQADLEALVSACVS